MTWPPSSSDIGDAFDARADTYDTSAMHRWVASAAARLVHVAPAAVVLDAAAGTALAGRGILRHEPSARVVAVDLSGGLLSAGRRVDSRVLPVRGDVSALPLADQCVDAVVCVSALAFVANPATALVEFARVLRPAAHLVVQVWLADGLSLPRLFRRAAASVGVSLVDPNAALGTTSDVTNELRAAGFTDIATTETVWTQPFPSIESAWAAMTDSVAGGPVRELPAAAFNAARRRFAASLLEEIERTDVDSQQLLLATAVRGH